MKDQIYLNNAAGTYNVYNLEEKHGEFEYIVIANLDTTNPLQVDIKCVLGANTYPIMTVIIPPGATQEFNPKFDLIGNVSITLSTTGVVSGVLNIITE